MMQIKTMKDCMGEPLVGCSSYVEKAGLTKSWLNEMHLQCLVNFEMPAVSTVSIVKTRDEGRQVCNDPVPALSPVAIS